MTDSFVLNLATNEMEVGGTDRRGNFVLKGYTEFYPETDDDDAIYLINIVVPDETTDFASNVIGSDSPAEMTVIYDSAYDPNLITIRFGGRSTPK